MIVGESGEALFLDEEETIPERHSSTEGMTEGEGDGDSQFKVINMPDTDSGTATDYSCSPEEDCVKEKEVFQTVKR